MNKLAIVPQSLPIMFLFFLGGGGGGHGPSDPMYVYVCMSVPNMVGGQ